MQERPVVCQDLASGVKLMDSNCSGGLPKKHGCLCSVFTQRVKDVVPPGRP